MGGVAGKVVLVTGAGKGRGRQVAEGLARAGAIVAVNDISPINLDLTVEHIRAAGGQVKEYVEDIAKKMPIQALLNNVLDDFSRIDILVNCAEVEPVAGVLQMDEWDWQRTLDVNLTGAFLLTQSTGRIMKEQGSGLILHMKGQAQGMDRRAAYFASKMGLEALVQSAAEELAPQKLMVQLVRSADEALEACSQWL